MPCHNPTAAPSPAAIPTHTFPPEYQKHDHHLLAALCSWNRERGLNKVVAELKMSELSDVLQRAARLRMREQFDQALGILTEKRPSWWRRAGSWMYRGVVLNGE